MVGLESQTIRLQAWTRGWIPPWGRHLRVPHRESTLCRHLHSDRSQCGWDSGVWSGPQRENGQCARRQNAVLSLTTRQHLAVPLVMQAITGATTSSIFTVRIEISLSVILDTDQITRQLCGTLLTDLNPHASATVQASYNLVRCLMAGAGIGIQQPLADAAGVGWCFGVFAIIMLLALPLAMLTTNRGLKWRKQQQEKKRRKKEEKKKNDNEKNGVSGQEEPGLTPTKTSSD